jgi:hypothetical protein
MNTYAVWEAEYPEEGSTLFDALTEKGAMRRYRKATREKAPRHDLVPLNASLMTPTLLAKRRRMAEAT